MFATEPRFTPLLIPGRPSGSPPPFIHLLAAAACPLPPLILHPSAVTSEVQHLFCTCCSGRPASYTEGSAGSWERLCAGEGQESKLDGAHHARTVMVRDGAATDRATAEAGMRAGLAACRKRRGAARAAGEGQARGRGQQRRPWRPLAGAPLLAGCCKAAGLYWPGFMPSSICGPLLGR